MNQRNRAFTIVELLVVVSIIALLVGILLPAIGKARDQARLSLSQANLRNLAAAHATYAAEWSDRQFTLIDDNISTYGSSAGVAFPAYANAHGGASAVWHPPIYLGWGYSTDGSAYGLWHYPMGPGWSGNFGLPQPIVFQGGIEYFGAFRFPNARQFSQYINGRFYDPVFYAPKDTVVVDTVEPCFEDPGEFCQHVDVVTDLGDIPAWSSYCLSPASMFNPEVMRHNDAEDPTANGWTDPWSLGAGFRSPGMSQALYPDLKTHMLEHHWLQNRQADCNPGFTPGTYGGCEPYYFNHSWESVPMTLFYDGHIEGVGVRESMRADGRMRQQTGQDDWGLWSMDTPFGDDGYFIQYGFDQAATSFHILTTDGIRGRDRIK